MRACTNPTMLFHRLAVVIFVLGFASGQPILLADEAESLQAIGQTLRKTDWNFSVDPCSGLSGWTTPNPIRGRENAVTCNCTFANNTICHVVSIILRSQNLSGSVPPELINLPFLVEIDLTRNYLDGFIPPQWGSMKLKNISLSGNRVTGPIPKELANITTLANLTLDTNQLSGTIPPELGTLPHIERIILSSNYLTGEIPANLANLSTLRDFRISDNNFTGQIPNFIQNWTNIERLLIQASGLTGPIPPLTSLTKLRDLRISDLSGNESTFPLLSNMKMLKTLILRSCNIIGQLPRYIGEMTKLRILDLSFNGLNGSIPDSFYGQVGTDYIYLTGNALTGQVPSWMLNEGENIDLSYNNLTSEVLEPNCQPRNNLNLFASSKGHTFGIASCLRSSKCERNYSLHINCGGPQVYDDEGTTYEADMADGRNSNFYLSKTNWGFSSTGNFLDDDRPLDTIISMNTSRIFGQSPNLYGSARASPLSLTYYAFCLMNGNYTVSLHFAENMFTNDRTFSSLGRRLFDVYIQGMRVLKDFNIENEVGTVNVGIRKRFNTVVDDNTLDIRFYWAGKGTTSIPFRGVYGPLISAISADHKLMAPPENANAVHIAVGAIIGIVVGVLFTVVLFVAIVWWKCYRGRKDTMLRDLKGINLNIESFTLRQIKAATNNFDPANKIGEGGFGPVYKGHLPNGRIVAVKQLSSKSKQGNREFVNEIGMISAVQHPHLVKLYGCSVEDNQLLLVYEYMENNSLARALFGQEEQQLHLDWPIRHKICIGIARGLAHLHGETPIKIVHRDIKATNVLLDKNLVPKISDFGLAKLHEEDNTHISTRIAGTLGYMAPEYALRGYLTDKADVYSFGVVLLEIVSGRSNIVIRPNDDYFSLLDWANSLKEKGNLLELVDPRLGSNFDQNEVMTVINVALLCTKTVARGRPSMSIALNMLEGKVSFTEFVPNLRLDGQDEFNGFDNEEGVMLRTISSSSSIEDTTQLN